MRAERGFLLAGRYELTGLIAIGGMGEVWRAHDQVLGRAVAVKLLRPEHAGDASFLARFRDEARHAASLAHPNIATVHDYGEQEGWAYLVMELVEGESLAARLARTGPTGPAAAVAVLGQVGEALAVAHRAGIVHRDVKPANILLTPDGRVKLTDFGIAKAVGARSHTASGVVVGTARYLSPEQATGAPTSPASDVYAMGLVGYEMLVGHPPFTGPNDVAVALAQVRELPPSLPPTVPPRLGRLIGESLAKDPGRRPPDATAFLARLAAVAPAGGVAPRPPAGGAAPDRAERTIVAGPVADEARTAVAPTGFGAASARPATAADASGAAGRPVLGDLPARHRTRRRLAAAGFGVLAIAAVVGGGLLVVRAVGGDDGSRADATPPPVTAAPTIPSTTAAPTTTAPPTTTTTTTVPTTTVPPFDFGELEVLVGQDVEHVTPLLDLAGVDYDVEYVETRRRDRGRIVDVETDGPLYDGGTLILHVGASESDGPGNGDGGPGNGNGGPGRNGNDEDD